MNIIFTYEVYYYSCGQIQRLTDHFFKSDLYNLSEKYFSEKNNNIYEQ